MLLIFDRIFTEQNGFSKITFDIKLIRLNSIVQDGAKTDLVKKINSAGIYLSRCR